MKVTPQKTIHRKRHFERHYTAKDTIHKISAVVNSSRTLNQVIFYLQCSELLLESSGLCTTELDHCMHMDQEQAA